MLKEYDIERIECKFLSHQRPGGIVPGPPHTHSFWQISLNYEGAGSFFAQGVEYKFSGGELIIAPGGLEHYYRYPGVPGKWLALGFSVENYSGRLLPLVLLPDPTLDHLLKAIDRLLCKNILSDDLEKCIINSILKAIVQIYCQQVEGKKQVHSTFIHQILDYVDHRGAQHITVNDIAKYTGFSAKYCSARFKKEHGQPLKKFLDEERFKHACNLLGFWENSISEVAELLGFPDVYAFSRFFRRQAKQSPSHFRKQQFDTFQT